VSSPLQSWKQRERQVIDGQFPLRQYLGGCNHNAVFVTERGKPRPEKAAIKLVPASIAPSDQLARWQAAAKLSHPHLLRLFESGRCHFDNEAYLYVVMEYAEEDLSQILPSRSLSSAEANEMLPPVLDTLRYLHGQGLAHGHLKPSNIMAISDTLKLASDGISRAGNPTENPTARGVYDAPEVNEGKSPASDIWSLGMTLVEVLTQRPPLREGNEGEPLLPQTMPAPFREIASQCLRRDPQKRWTLDQIEERLRPAKTVKPGPKLVVRPKEPVGAEEPPTKRWRRPAIAGLVLLAAIFVVIKFFGHRTETAAPASTSTTLAEGKGGSTSAPGAASPGVPRKPGAAPSTPQKSGNPSSSAPAGGGGGGTDILQQVVPEPSRSARNTIQGTIKVNVRVDIDSAGNVSDARFERRGPSNYFANQAMQAARQWKFSTHAPHAWILHFEFRRSGTRVIPQPAGS
jgi:TonB family protein